MSPRPIAPRAAFIAEQIATDIARWIIHTLLPTLAATMLGLTLWAVGVAAVGLSLMGCATPAPADLPSAPPPTDPQCVTLVFASELDHKKHRPTP